MLGKVKAWAVESFRENTYLGYLVIPRLLVGYNFLEGAMGLINEEVLSGRELPRRLAETIAGDPIAWHRAFIENVVIPNAALFGYLVSYGQLAIALSLFTGCLVRVASSFGCFVNLNIFLAIGYPAGGAQMRLNRIFIFLHLIFVIASAGRSLGVDGWLKKKYPRCWLF